MILVDGRLAPELSALIAGSSQVVILPWKILATTSGVSVRSVTPLRLKATPIGIGDHRQVDRGCRRSACSPTATSPFDGSSAASEPPKSTWPPVNCLTPAPEPVGVVGDRRAGALRLVLLDPVVHHVLLRGRALALERAGRAVGGRRARRAGRRRAAAGGRRGLELPEFLSEPQAASASAPASRPAATPVRYSFTCVPFRQRQMPIRTLGRCRWRVGVVEMNER